MSIQHRARVRDAVRAFFGARGYLEVETPSLVRSPDIAPSMSHLVTDVRVRGCETERMALVTSPEYALKKLVGHGESSVWELARVFRNDEPRDAWHQSEFCMLEWYRLGATFQEGMDETLDLLRAVGLLSGEASVLTVETLFREHAGMHDLRNPSRESYTEALDRLGQSYDADDTRSDLFQRIFLNAIEPHLRAQRGVTVVAYYPAHEAALARLNADGYAERFEIYVAGVELCNAFGELTDAAQQQRRFEEELEERRRLGREIFPIDEDLLEALTHIQQPLFGNAMGFDRLVALLERNATTF